MPTVTVDRQALAAGLPVLDLLAGSGLVASKAEARRLIQQGGLTINGHRIGAVDQMFTLNDLEDNCLVVRMGKKRFSRVQPQ
jgi:tyrosyl-tRNA synthetase